MFTFFQAFEYSHAAFSYSGNIYGASFFMATGFHGAHVIIGTVFLFVWSLEGPEGPFHAYNPHWFRNGGLVLGISWMSSGFSSFAAIYIWGS